MASIPPPQGMSEVDYETIEAAVTETVRGRWFLAEFARRNRLAETKQLLEAMGRIEAVVSAGQVALPSADPSIRLLVQRIKEVAGTLGGLAGELRAAGVEAHLVEAVDAQARAVAGMMRSATPASLPPKAPASSPAAVAPPVPASPVAQPAIEPPPTRAEPPAPPRMPRADLPPHLARPAPSAVTTVDPRLAVLSAFDEMPIAEKLAVFG